MYFARELRPSGSPQPIKIPLQISHAKFIVKKSCESLKSSSNEHETNKIPNGKIIDWAFKTKIFLQSIKVTNDATYDCELIEVVSCEHFIFRYLKFVSNEL